MKFFTAKIQRRPRNQVQENETIVQFKFVVSLEQIRLKNDWPVECILKYQYSLFSPKEIDNGPAFTISSDNDENYIIPLLEGFNEFELSPTIHESDVKMYLDNHSLKIQIFDNISILQAVHLI